MGKSKTDNVAIPPAPISAAEMVIVWTTVWREAIFDVVFSSSFWNVVVVDVNTRRDDANAGYLGIHKN
jgi:hypothetical protein